MNEDPERNDDALGYEPLECRLGEWFLWCLLDVLQTRYRDKDNIRI